MKRLLLVLLFALALAGCEAEPMKFSDPQRFSDSVQYFKDPVGNCFAMVGIRGTGRASMAGVGLAYIPPNRCPLR